MHCKHVHSLQKKCIEATRLHIYRNALQSWNCIEVINNDCKTNLQFEWTTTSPIYRNALQTCSFTAKNCIEVTQLHIYRNALQSWNCIEVINNNCKTNLQIEWTTTSTICRNALQNGCTELQNLCRSLQRTSKCLQIQHSTLQNDTLITSKTTANLIINYMCKWAGTSAFSFLTFIKNTCLIHCIMLLPC